MRGCNPIMDCEERHCQELLRAPRKRNAPIETYDLLLEKARMAEQVARKEPKETQGSLWFDNGELKVKLARSGSQVEGQKLTRFEILSLAANLSPSLIKTLGRGVLRARLFLRDFSWQLRKHLNKTL